MRRCRAEDFVRSSGFEFEHVFYADSGRHMVAIMEIGNIVL
jgi:hypothetical protein